MTLFYNETAHILRPPSRRSRSGETTLDYTNLELEAGRPWTNLRVRAVSQLEVVGEDRQTAITGWRIASEPYSGDVDLLPTDWIRIPDGSVCRVVGDVARPTDPLSPVLHHVEVQLTKASG